jgi:GTP-binding protein
MNAEFIKSSSSFAQAPEPLLPEYAFIGRSNVGKSSLINMLTGRKNLAMVGATPGKTRLINHFLIDKKWYLVDLPGYGFALRSKQERNNFQGMIEDYVLNRSNLMNIFLLIDSRLAPQRNDLEVIQRLGEAGVAFSLVFTKCDKLGINARNKNIEEYKQKLLETWEELPPYFITSSLNSVGKSEILNYIAEVNKQF